MTVIQMSKCEEVTLKTKEHNLGLISKGYIEAIVIKLPTQEVEVAAPGSTG